MMFIILNRLRGTWSFMSKVNGVILGILVYLIFGDWTTASLVAIGYVAGESFGWGEWIGTLTTDRTNYVDNSEGKNNGIRFLANKIYSPETEWRNYCRVALTLRGLYWWLPTLLPLVMAGINIYVIVASIIILSIGFPIACELDRKYPLYIIQSTYFSIWGHWETQEVYYGIIQDIILIGIFISIYFT